MKKKACTFPTTVGCRCLLKYFQNDHLEIRKNFGIGVSWDADFIGEV